MNIPLVILSGAAKGCEVEESVHSKDEGERILRLVSLAQDDMGVAKCRAGACSRPKIMTIITTRFLP